MERKSSPSRNDESANSAFYVTLSPKIYIKGRDWILLGWCDHTGHPPFLSSYLKIECRVHFNANSPQLGLVRQFTAIAE